MRETKFKFRPDRRGGSVQRHIVTVLTVGFLVITSSSSVRGAGSNAAEEAAIRKLIVAGDQGGTEPGPHLPDVILWNAVYKRPTVGNEKREPFSGPTAVENRVPGSQKVKTEPIRIVIADSRDLAYEYSKGTVEFDLKSGEHVSFDRGLLRVWQKQGGDWKVAAAFYRPYDTAFLPDLRTNGK
jgi:ketosteroid isomerase-like protein